MPRSAIRHPLLLLLLLLSSLVPTTGQTATIRVDVDGGSDYSSIGAALDASSPADTILVAPGTYSGPDNTGLTSNDAELHRAQIIISENGPDETTIDLTGSDEHAISFVNSGGGPAVIDGFTFVNGGTAPDFVCGLAVANITLRNCAFQGNAGTVVMVHMGFAPHWITIENCSFDGNGGRVIDVEGAVRVEGCEFTDNASNCLFVDEVAFEGGFAEIADCSFINNDDTPVVVASPQGTMTSITFTMERCVYVGNADGAVRVGTSFTSDMVDRCTFVGNTSDGQGVIDVGGWSGLTRPVLVKRSVIAFNECDGAFTCSGTDPLAFQTNIIYENAGGDSLCGDHSDTWFIDPLLCDIASGDVRPCADSFCLPDVNQLGIGAIGAYEAAGCGPCDETPVESMSWGRIKALYRGGR